MASVITVSGVPEKNATTSIGSDASGGGDGTPALGAAEGTGAIPIISPKRAPDDAGSAPWCAAMPPAIGTIAMSSATHPPPPPARIRSQVRATDGFVSASCASARPTFGIPELQMSRSVASNGGSARYAAIAAIDSDAV